MLVHAKGLYELEEEGGVVEGLEALQGGVEEGALLLETHKGSQFVLQLHCTMRNALLRELRLHFSVSDPQAKGLCAFLQNQYATAKAQLNQAPFLVREAQHATPKLVARYGKHTAT